MNHNQCKNTLELRRNTQWSRVESAQHVVDFENVRAEHGTSQRQFAKENEISRTTLQYQFQRKKEIDELPEYVEFFETPAGVLFLHQIIVALHFIFTKVGCASIHNVSEFLKLSGLKKFVASSYSYLRNMSEIMDELIAEFGKEEFKRLIPNMPKNKLIALAEDETFHPKTCLVAMEPVSNLILVEKYAENRNADTWNTAVFEAINPLPVQVIQTISDEARGLISHAEKGLGAHHSSDAFHVSYEISKGTNGPLASAVKKAQKEYEVVTKEKESEIKRKERYDNQLKRPPGRRPNFEKKIEAADAKLSEAETRLTQAAENQETVKDANAEIGQVYHPYNLETGEAQDGNKARKLLDDCFNRIRNATDNLADRCKQRIEKAYRVTDKFVANIIFFFSMIDIYMDNIKLNEDEKELMRQCLIPASYLAQAAEKERDKEKKARLQEQSQQLLDMATNRDGPVQYLPERISQLQTAAAECARIFQRSSSCVEGRNAQLSLRHHGLHRLSDKQLEAQTVIHNFWIKRSDGTTPARRFFNAEHNDLFTYLLKKMDFPARPRNRLTTDD